MGGKSCSKITRREFIIDAAITLGFLASDPLKALAEDNNVRVEDFYLNLGDSKIKVRKHTGKDTGIVYWRPHSNEAIAAKSIEDHISRFGGIGYIIYTLNNTRDIPFKIGTRSYSIDPNRIFTKAGRVNNCAAAYGTRKYHAIKDFADKWLQILKQYHTIVAVHNNFDGFTGDTKNGRGTISIDRYAKRYAGRYHGAVHVSSPEDEDDLFWVTNKSDFNYLKNAKHPANSAVNGYNVILEPNVIKSGAYDDGSTSVVFCRKPHLKRYFNCETEDGKSNRPKQEVLQKQLEMLRVIHDYAAK